MCSEAPGRPCVRRAGKRTSITGSSRCKVRRLRTDPCRGFGQSGAVTNENRSSRRLLVGTHRWYADRPGVVWQPIGGFLPMYADDEGRECTGPRQDVKMQVFETRPPLLVNGPCDERHEPVAAAQAGDLRRTVQTAGSDLDFPRVGFTIDLLPTLGSVRREAWLRGRVGRCNGPSPCLTRAIRGMRLVLRGMVASGFMRGPLPPAPVAATPRSDTSMSDVTGNYPGLHVGVASASLDGSGRIRTQDEGRRRRFRPFRLRHHPRKIAPAHYPVV